LANLFCNQLASNPENIGEFLGKSRLGSSFLIPSFKILIRLVVNLVLAEYNFSLYTLTLLNNSSSELATIVFLPIVYSYTLPCLVSVGLISLSSSAILSSVKDLLLELYRGNQ
jgi:hypothetical protein